MTEARSTIVRTPRVQTNKKRDCPSVGSPINVAVMVDNMSVSLPYGGGVDARTVALCADKPSSGSVTRVGQLLPRGIGAIPTR